MTPVSKTIKFLLFPFHHIRYFVAAFGIVFFWRGIWVLLDRFFIPEDQTKSAVLCVIIGLILLYVDDFKLNELRSGKFPASAKKKPKA